jgi:hypothetical protein
MIDVEIIICMPTLPLPKARVASPDFQDMAFGSAILYFVAQSNQNCKDCCTSGVFNWAVFEIWRKEILAQLFAQGPDNLPCIK